MKRRRITLVALLAATLAAGAHTPPAWAGEYPVYACEPAFGDVNHSWFPESNNRKMTAYTACPVPSSETRFWNQGLVTRQSVTSGGTTDTVPGFAYAAMRLRAPPGAGISRMTYQYSFCAGLYFYAGLINDANQQVFGSTPPGCGVFAANPWTLYLNGTPSVALITICARTTCQIDGNLRSWASMRSVTVWIADSTAPAVSITGGEITAPGWHRGTPSVAVAAGDNVGVRHIEVALDGTRAAEVDGACDWTFVVPCSTSPGSLPVDSRKVSDGAHTLAIAAQDSAGNWGSATRSVLIDNTAPAGPLDMEVVGGEGWRSTNRFDVRWTNPPQGGRAPIAGVDYAICPASNGLDDFRGCSTGSRPGAGIAQITGLRVPAPGDWVGRFWLADQAGNVDRQTARSIHLRYDAEPPTVTILDRDPADPQRIAVAASDALAGVSGVNVEIRRAGSQSWLSLPVAPDGAVYVARLDDAVLPRGHYEVRAWARDGAGNERTTDAQAGGAPAAIDLPVRIPTTLALGGARRTRDRHGHVHTVLRRRATLPFGRRIGVRGRLTIPGGNPLSGANVDIFQQVALPGAAWRRVALVHTNARGDFAYNAPAGPSRRLRFTYAGTPLIQPRTGYVHVRVRAATTFHVNHPHVVNGDEVVFHGRVLGHVPRRGKLVQLQAYSRGSWRTFATPRARGHGHRWRYPYRFSATRGLVRYRFRAVVPAEAGFPYVRGVSRRLRVTVRGL